MSKPIAAMALSRPAPAPALKNSHGLIMQRATIERDHSDKDFLKVGGGAGDKYGKEWDVSAAYAYNKNILGKVEYGTYQEDDLRLAGRVRDTDKLWLTLMYTF